MAETAKNKKTISGGTYRKEKDHQKNKKGERNGILGGGRQERKGNGTV